MDSRLLSIIIVLAVLAGAGVGALIWNSIAFRLKKRREAKALRELFEETNRQRTLELINRRKEIYLGFRNASTALVEELADGGGRWGAFYVVRDTLAAMSERADPEISLAAKQMCFVCQQMLHEGFSDEMYVRFNQALQRFDLATEVDLKTISSDPNWALSSGEITEPNMELRDAETSSGRKYFHVDP